MKDSLYTIQTGALLYTEKEILLLFYFKYIPFGRYLLINMVITILNDGEEYSQIMKPLISFHAITLPAALTDRQYTRPGCVTLLLLKNLINKSKMIFGTLVNDFADAIRFSAG